MTLPTPLSPDDGTLPLAREGLTMSSREIAELVGARHDSVRRTIERLGEKGVVALPPLVEKPTDGRPAVEYVFAGERGKRDSIIVVAQLSPEFTARLVDRWQELEQRQQVAAAPLSRMDLIQLALAAEKDAQAEREQRLLLEAKVEEVAPKAEFYDRFACADGLYGLQNAGRALNQPPNKFIRWLKREFLFYQGGSLIPRRPYVERGIFEVKSELVDDKARQRTWITPKGLQYLAKKLGMSLNGELAL